MDTIALQRQAEITVAAVWAKFVTIYPRLNKPCPKIIINNRLKTTAGRCDFTARLIDLSPLLFNENITEFISIIIPHEVAHQVAWDIYGDSGHGSDWKSVMVNYGIPAERCHKLISTVIESTRAVNTQRKLRKIAAEFVLGDVATFVHTNRQREQRNIIGVVSKINLKTIKLIERGTGAEWTIPKENTCNLRHA
jgi:predicted SprT family Zn-dependent metalloprotease